MIKKSAQLLIVLQLVPFLFSSLSIASPTEYLLTVVSQHSVEIRRNSLPTLLTEKSKKAAIAEVLNRAIKTIQSSAKLKQSPDVVSDTEALKSDPLVHTLLVNLLFSGNDPKPLWFSKINVPNPSYNKALEKYPEAHLTHGTNSKGFLTALMLGRIGKNVNEDWPNYSPDQEVLAQNFSLPLRGYTGTYLEFRPTRELTDHKKFFNSGGVQFVFKPEVLKRWDYHMSSDHYGAMFKTSVQSSNQRSFGPAQFSEYAKFKEEQLKENPRETHNEFLFFNPLPISAVQEIMVSQAAERDVRTLLKDYRFNIPVRVMGDEIAGEWDPKGAVESTSSGPPVRDARRAGRLSQIVEAILSEPEVLKKFEASIDVENYHDDTESRLLATFRSGEMSFLNPTRSSTEKVIYSLRGFHSKFLELGKDLSKREEFEKSLFEACYSVFKKKDNGEFNEPWMVAELELIKPLWETRLARELCDAK